MFIFSSSFFLFYLDNLTKQRGTYWHLKFKTLYISKQNSVDNLHKFLVKEKIDGIRQPNTGGGPPSAPLTQEEEALNVPSNGHPTQYCWVGRGHRFRW